MTETSTATPSERVAERVKKLRNVRGLTVKGLADRCAELGAPRLNSSVITNIEVVGRRQDVGVGELLVLAHALDVSPLTLLMPEDGAAVTVVPAVAVDPYRLVLWFAGERPAAGPPSVQFEKESAALRWYRAAYDAERRANEADRNARWARKDGDDGEADQLEAERDRHLQALAGVIDSLVEAGMSPQPINPGWARKMIRRGWFRNPNRVPVVELPEDD